MHMKATISGKQLAAGLLIPAAEWRNLGNGLRLRIINRTRGQHVDADGTAFQPYSEGYRKAKQKKGGLVSGVNLTGAAAGPKMLDNITVLSVSESSNPRIVLGFATADKGRIARYHMGEGRVDREFFGLSEADLDYGVDYIRKRLARRA